MAGSCYWAAFLIPLPSPNRSLAVLLLKCTACLRVGQPNSLSLCVEERVILSSLQGESTKLEEVEKFT